MRNETVERVTEWESEPFTDGYGGLRELAGREFTGAATDGHAWLFLLNGRVLGAFDGSLSSFENADGTAYSAPDPSLALLFAMQETEGETRAEYYTEKTSISQVNRKLESGNFTGYIELSDNVLSGDYYIAYYGGRSLPAAFVGNNGDLLTGDEAFERADDEVGIYQVNTVELDITDIPTPEPSEPVDPTPTPTESESDPDPVDTDASEEPASETKRTEQSEGEATEPADSAGSTERTDSAQSADSTDFEAGNEPEPESTGTDSEPTEPETEPVEQESDRAERTRPTETAESADATEAAPAEPQREQSESVRGEPTAEHERSRGPTSEPEATEESTTETVGSAGRSVQQWRGAKTIPALDPDESVDLAEEVDGPAPEEPAPEAPATTKQPRQPANGPAVQELEAERDRLQERIEELETETKQLETETEELEADADRLRRERDDARSEVNELEQEVSELRTTVEQLESELSTAESELAAAEEYLPEGDHEVDPERALEGTNLFVRYDRQGGPTLSNAHDGDADREAVNENLRLEHHTEFNDEGAIVNGEAFPSWLHDTIEYGFARWLVQGLIHDIRETRNQSALSNLYDAIPDIDRVEFRGTVNLDGEVEDAPDSVKFDVVLRDRMGSPLLAADLNGSREPATEPMLASLIENATPVAKAQEEFASAFFVTTSYYEPGALETAEEATGSGFLSRDKQKSLVKLSRKRGYHLCLVETRDGEFHVSVPEL